MTARGFSLVELLIACALLAVIGGAVAALARPLRVALARADSSAQLEPAATAALEPLVADIREAGADAAIADLASRLALRVPRVTPLLDLETNTPALVGGAVRVVRTPRGGAQGTLSAAAAAGSGVLWLDTAARCSGGPPVCGFAAGTVAVIYNAEAAELVTVDATGGATVVLVGRLGASYSAGAALAEIVNTTYGTRRQADGSRQLVRLTTGGAEQPVLDSVVEFAVTTDSPDLARVERVDLRIRLEAPLAALRGPAGYFFRRAGTAVSAREWLPDAELRLTVALRNPAGAP